MNVQGTPTQVLRDVRVPRQLVGDTAAFKGVPDGVFLRGDLVLTGERVAGMDPGRPTAQPRMVFPMLVEAHCHLDKCHTIDRLGGVGGDLPAAIEAQARDKVNWTVDDIKARARRGLDELEAAGCGLVRSHVDWGDGPEPPPAWAALGDLADETGRNLQLERAALIGVDQMADTEFAVAVARRIAQDGGVLGAFVLHQPKRSAGIRTCFEMADRFGLALDFHVDEGLDPALNGLEHIADAALETGFQGPVLCGHACALMNHTAASRTRLFAKLAASGLSIAALPTTNLYLQGRTDGTPDRRGLTRLRELHAAGVPIVVGSDNVADAFCPTGRHDPFFALHLAVLAAHLDPPLDQWLTLVTTNAAAALGRPFSGFAGAHISQLRLSDAASLSDLVSARVAAPTPLHEHLELL